MGQNWVNLLWVFLVIGAPAISWTVGKLREQYEKKRLRDIQRSREEESIRMTRIADRGPRVDPEQERADRLAELAARRQAQLEELRQRRGVPLQERRGEQGPVIVGMPTGAPPRPGVPRAPRPQAPPAGRTPAGAPRPRPTVSAPTPVPAPVARPRGPVRPVTPTRPIESFERAAMAAPAPIAASEVHSVDLDAAARRLHRTGTSASVRAMLRGEGPGGRSTLATALVLSEVLSKPMGLRSEPPGASGEV